MKIKTKLFVLVVQVGKKLLEEIIPNFKLQISIFFLILPILILAVFFILFEARLSNLFFMIIFLLNYYMVIFILILVFAKSFRVKKARSPFYFIKRLNFILLKDSIKRVLKPIGININNHLDI